MSALKSLRTIAFAEGVSVLVLLLVAMPLKYWAGIPMAVRIVGMIHGVLFVAFLASLARAATSRSWGMGRCAFAFAASLIPGGTFVLDASLRREMDELVPEIEPA